MRSINFVTVAASALFIVACNPSPENPAKNVERPDTFRKLESKLDDQALAFCRSVDALQNAVTKLADEPSTLSLTTAKEKWISAHRAYQIMELAYRLNREPPPVSAGDQRDPIDASPIIGGYLDRVPDYPTSGIAYSEVPLTPRFLREEHQSTDFGYLTLGFHPLEFLLWGTAQHQSHERFISAANADEQNTVDAPERRRTMLRLISSQLNQDARRLCDEQARQNLIAVTRERLDTPKERQAAMAYIIGIFSATPSQGALFEIPDDHSIGRMHSAYARTDRGDLDAKVEALKSVWVPALFEDKAEQREWISRLDTLGERIYQPISESPSEPAQSSP